MQCVLLLAQIIALITNSLRVIIIIIVPVYSYAKLFYAINELELFVSLLATIIIMVVPIHEAVLHCYSYIN